MLRVKLHGLSVFGQANVTAEKKVQMYEKGPRPEDPLAMT